MRAGLDRGDAVVGHDLVLWGRVDLVPVDLGALASVGEPAVEKQEEVAHLVLEKLVQRKRPTRGFNIATSLPNAHKKGPIKKSLSLSVPCARFRP